MSRSRPRFAAREKSKDLRTLTSYHRQILYEEIARRLLERHGPARICLDLSITKNTLRKILKTQTFRSTFDELKARIYQPIDAALTDERMGLTERLDHGMQRALTKAFDLLENARSEHVQARVVGDLLNRHPDTAPIKRAQGTSIDRIQLDKDSIAFLAEALQAGRTRQKVIDVQATEESTE